MSQPRIATRCRCIGTQDGQQLCRVSPNLPYDPYFGVEDEEEKKVLAVILRSHLTKESANSKPLSAVLQLERHEAPPRPPRLRYKVCEAIYGKRPSSSSSAQVGRRKLLTDETGELRAETPASEPGPRPSTADPLSFPLCPAGLDKKLVTFITNACQGETDDYGMIQLGQAFARRALPWNAQMCPQAMEHLEALRVKAERAKEAQLVLEHRSDQVGRVRDFIRQEKKRLAAWFQQRREEGAARDHMYLQSVGNNDQGEVLRTEEDWALEVARLPLFEEAEYAKVNAAETVNLENNLIAEAMIKVIGFGSVNARALKRTLEDARLKAAEEAESLRSGQEYRQEEAYSHLLLRGEKAKLEIVARKELARLRQLTSAEITTLDFAHASVMKTYIEACDAEWEEVMKHEQEEAQRVHKQLRVQEALARTSTVYIMHLLTHYNRPQNQKLNRDEMFWEIKRVAQLTTQKRKVVYDQRLFDIVDTQRAQRTLRGLIRNFKRSAEEELRVWFERSKRGLEERQQDGELHTRAHVRGLKDGVKTRWRAKHDLLVGHRQREEDIVRALGQELATCRDLEEKEALRLILEAHQRRYHEDSRAEADRQRLNHLISAWRSQFAELIETVRQEVVTWVVDQKQSVHRWAEETDKLIKEAEKNDLQRVTKAAKHELDRSTAAARTLTEEVFKQMVAVLDRLHRSESQSGPSSGSDDDTSVLQNAGSPLETERLGHAFHVEVVKILEGWGELWLAEVAKGERAHLEQAEARAETIKQEESRFKAAWQDFHDAFLGSAAAYVNDLLDKNNVTRSTLDDFFRTEDSISKEMLLEEEQEALKWQQKQEGKARTFHKGHRERAERFVLQQEDLKKKAGTARPGRDEEEDHDEQASLQTIESLGTLVHDDLDPDMLGAEGGEGANDDEEVQPDRLVQRLRERLVKDKGEDGRVSLRQLKDALDAQTVEDLTSQQSVLLLAYGCPHNEPTILVEEFLRKASILVSAFRVVQKAKTKGGDSEEEGDGGEEGKAQYEQAVQRLAAEDARLAMGHIRQAMALSAGGKREGTGSKAAPTGAKPLQTWGQEQLVSVLRETARWSPYLSPGDVSVLAVSYTVDDDSGVVDEPRLQTILAGIRYASLQHASAWVGEHSLKSLRHYFQVIGRKVVSKRDGVCAKSATEAPDSSAAQQQQAVVLSIKEVATALEHDSCLTLSKAQVMALLSEPGNVFSPTCMIKGHPAYPLKRWTQILSVWLMRELSPDRIVTVPSLLNTPEYYSLFPHSRPSDSSSVSISSSSTGSSCTTTQAEAASTTSHKTAYVRAVMAMLEPLELKGMHGYLPVSVVRNCLVSGQHIRGVKPGMADVAIMAASLEPRQWRPLDDDDDEGGNNSGNDEGAATKQASVFGKLVQCRSSECAVEYRVLVGYMYEAFIMLLRSAWLSRCAGHKTEGMAASSQQAVSWTDLLTARQRRLLHRSDMMRQLTREQWQLIHSRIIHERHARRVTSEMLLRVHDTDTTKLAEALLKRTEEPLKNVREEGESLLSGCMGLQQRVMDGFEKYRENLEAIVQEDAKVSLEDLGVAVQMSSVFFEKEWQAMMGNLGKVLEWVRKNAWDDSIKVSNWKQGCITAYQNVQNEDELRRRQDDVMLALANMDTIEATVNFINRLTAEAEKITREAYRAQSSLVKELFDSLQVDRSSHVAANNDGDNTTSSNGSDRTTAERSSSVNTDPAEGPHKTVIKSKTKQEVTDMCNGAQRRVEAINLAAHSKLSKLQVAIQEQVELTVSQQRTRHQDYSDKQLGLQEERFKIARQRLSEKISEETTRHRSMHEARCPDFQSQLDQERRRVQVKWAQHVVKEMTRFKTKEEQMAVKAATRCARLAESAAMEPDFIREQVNSKSATCKLLIMDRCAMQINTHDDALRQASELSTSELRRWTHLIVTKRVRGEVQTVLDLTASTVEVKASFEANWQRCIATLKQKLQVQADKAISDCQESITGAENQFEALVKAQDEEVRELLQQIDNTRIRTRREKDAILQQQHREEARASKERSSTGSQHPRKSGVDVSS